MGRDKKYKDPMDDGLHASRKVRKRRLEKRTYTKKTKTRRRKGETLYKKAVLSKTSIRRLTQLGTTWKKHGHHRIYLKNILTRLYLTGLGDIDTTRIRLLDHDSLYYDVKKKAFISSSRAKASHDYAVRTLCQIVESDEDLSDVPDMVLKKTQTLPGPQRQ